jgi:hypothetical protein
MAKLNVLGRKNKLQNNVGKTKYVSPFVIVSNYENDAVRKYCHDSDIEEFEREVQKLKNLRSRKKKKNDWKPSHKKPELGFMICIVTTLLLFFASTIFGFVIIFKGMELFCIDIFELNPDWEAHNCSRPANKLQ